MNLDEEFGQQPTDSMLVSQVDRIASSSLSRCPVEESLTKVSLTRGYETHTMSSVFIIMLLCFYSGGDSCWSHSALQLVDRVQRKKTKKHSNWNKSCWFKAKRLFTWEEDCSLSTCSFIGVCVCVMVYLIEGNHLFGPNKCAFDPLIPLNSALQQMFLTRFILRGETVCFTCSWPRSLICFESYSRQTLPISFFSLLNLKCGNHTLFFLLTFCDSLLPKSELNWGNKQIHSLNFNFRIS